MLLEAASCQICAEDAGKVSPEKKETRMLLSEPGDSIFRRCMKPIEDGTENQTVGRILRRNAKGAVICVAGITINSAPEAQVRNISLTEMSKVISAEAAVLSSLQIA